MISTENIQTIKTKTKKNRDVKLNEDEKSKIWGLFDKDKEILGEPKVPIHREVGLCYICDTILFIMEDGFPTCTNPQCGIIYKDTLDYSPEWRFYGADDKN